MTGTACGYIASELISGIAHMHHQKVIHRDLKHTSVLVTYQPAPSAEAWAGNPSGLVVQVADSSRARVLPAGARTRQQQTTDVDCDGARVNRTLLLSCKITTVVYLAPEVLVLEASDERVRYGTATDLGL